MRLFVFRFPVRLVVWRGGEVLVLAMFLFVLAMVAAPVWWQRLPAMSVGVP